MRKKNYLKAILKAREKREKKRRSRCLKKCPKTTGDIIIGVHNGLSMAPLKNVQTSISGTTTATKKTDSMGIAVYPDLALGPHDYSVTYGASYTDWVHENETGASPVSSNTVTVRESNAKPTGTLVVEVKLRSTSALLPMPDITGITAGGTAGVGNPATFLNYPVGEVTPCAGVDALKYLYDSVMGDKAVVKAGKTTTVTLWVEEQSWVEVQVKDSDTDAVHTESIVYMKLPNDSTTGKRTAPGFARAEFEKKGDTAKINKINTMKLGETDHQYEFVSLE